MSVYGLPVPISPPSILNVVSDVCLCGIDTGAVLLSVGAEGLKNSGINQPQRRHK